MMSEFVCCCRSRGKLRFRFWLHRQSGTNGENIFILDCPPEPFREDVVHTATPSVHTDFDVVLKDEGREITTGELHALIRIPDIRCCNFECVRECFNAEICFKRRRHFPGDHISTEPVEDGHEIGEAAFQFHVRDIRSPDLIWTDNVEASEQIWILLVQWVPLAQSLLFLGYTASIPISSMRRRTWSRQMDVSWLWASSTRIRREP